jgi:hypothetical protein
MISPWPSDTGSGPGSQHAAGSHNATGPGAVEVALGVQDGGEVVEALGGIRVVGAQAGLADGQGALAEGAGAVEVALGSPLPHPPTLTIQQRSPRRGWRGPAPDLARRAHRRGLRGTRAMRLRLGVGACLLGWSEPGKQAKGGDAWWAAGRRAGPGRSASRPDRAASAAGTSSAGATPPPLVAVLDLLPGSAGPTVGGDGAVPDPVGARNSVVGAELGVRRGSHRAAMIGA